MNDTALRLADRLDLWGDQGDLLEAAAELRRLHALNAELVEALRQTRAALVGIGIVGQIDGHDVVRRESVIEMAERAALAKVEASK